MKFEQFCLRKAYKGPLEPGDSVEIPERYAVPVESLISTLKNKVHILDKVNVPFVEAVFDDDYESILGEKLVDGEVPDGLRISAPHPTALREAPPEHRKRASRMACSFSCLVIRLRAQPCSSGGILCRRKHGAEYRQRSP